VIGLKTYLTQIAPLLGLSPDMAYERQRALVREGMLKPRPGHGRGSGVSTDEDSLAVLLISILAHDFLVEAAATKVYCELAYSASRSRSDWRAASVDKCPITGAKTFRKALSTILANPVLPAKEILVEVMRGFEPHAEISLFNEEFEERSTFRHAKWKPGLSELQSSRVFHVVRIDEGLLGRLAEDIARFKKEGAS
jgi:hypothetical protein